MTSRHARTWGWDTRFPHGTSAVVSAYYFRSGHEGVADIPDRTALAGDRRSNGVRGPLALGCGGTTAYASSSVQPASGPPSVLTRRPDFPQRQSRRLSFERTSTTGIALYSLKAKSLKNTWRVNSAAESPSGHLPGCPVPSVLEAVASPLALHPSLKRSPTPSAKPQRVPNAQSLL